MRFLDFHFCCWAFKWTLIYIEVVITLLFAPINETGITEEILALLTLFGVDNEFLAYWTDKILINLLAVIHYDQVPYVYDFISFSAILGLDDLYSCFHFY